MSEHRDLTGGCLCGKVRYEVAGEPLMGGNCHCLNCQKTSGAGHVFHLMFPKSQVKITGETRSYSWTADSGNTATSFFCPTCGSPVYGTTTGFGDMITLRAASLDEADTFKPSMTVYAKRLRSWDQAADGVPSFPAMPPLQKP